MAISTKKRAVRPTAVKRVVGWEQRLADVIRAARDRRFERGRFDCALFACDVAKAMTGHDYAAGLRGRYRTAKGAARAMLRRHGVADLEALATTLLGPPIPPARARRGDVVAGEVEGEVALGVVLGAQAAFVAPGAGLVTVPTLSCQRAWRVG